MERCKICGQASLKLVKWQRRSADEEAEAEYSCMSCPLSGGRLWSIATGTELPNAGLSAWQGRRSAELAAALDKKYGLDVVQDPAAAEDSLQQNTLARNPPADDGEMRLQLLALASAACYLAAADLGPRSRRQASLHTLVHCVLPHNAECLPQTLPPSRSVDAVASAHMRKALEQYAAILSKRASAAPLHLNTSHDGCLHITCRDKTLVVPALYKAKVAECQVSGGMAHLVAWLLFAACIHGGKLPDEASVDHRGRRILGSSLCWSISGDISQIIAGRQRVEAFGMPGETQHKFLAPWPAMACRFGAYASVLELTRFETKLKMIESSNSILWINPPWNPAGWKSAQSLINASNGILKQVIVVHGSYRPRFLQRCEVKSQQCISSQMESASARISLVDVEKY